MCPPQGHTKSRQGTVREARGTGENTRELYLGALCPAPCVVSKPGAGEGSQARAPLRACDLATCNPSVAVYGRVIYLLPTIIR
jgi:hypothetical protein